MPRRARQSDPTPPNAQLLEALDARERTTEDEQLALVQAALAAGADPNLASRQFQNFRCALGIATAQQRPAVVAALLEAGARPHWPQQEAREESGEESIPAEELTGEDEYTGYSGRAVDPLAIVLDDLGWVLTESGASPAPEVMAQVATLRRIYTLLLDAGAPMRADPARWDVPLDRCMMILVENPTHHTGQGMQLAAECLFEIFHRLDAGNLTKMLAGQWRQMGACQWEWDEDLPDLAQHMAGLAQQASLQHDTPRARAMRAARL